MDNMLEHPWNELQVLIKEKWLTQKAFASILWKKVSELNELLKWKRNITIQRDYLLHQTLWTPIKYWILKQVDYDYSLLDIEEITSHQTSHSEPEASSASGWRENPSSITPMDFSLQSKWQEKFEGEIQASPLDKGDTAKPRGFEQPQETPVQESEVKDNKDLQNRAKIFRSF